MKRLRCDCKDAMTMDPEKKENLFILPVRSRLIRIQAIWSAVESPKGALVEIEVIALQASV